METTKRTQNKQKTQNTYGKNKQEKQQNGDEQQTKNKTLKQFNHW